MRFLIVGHNTKHLQFKGGKVSFCLYSKETQSIISWLECRNTMAEKGNRTKLLSYGSWEVQQRNSARKEGAKDRG